MRQGSIVWLLVAAFALAGLACGKASRKEHRRACEKYADIHLESEFELKSAQLPPDQKAEYRAELWAEFKAEGKREAFAKRCLGETNGAKTTFVSCMDRATNLVDTNGCVRSHQRTKKREERRKREKRNKDR